MPVPRRGLFLLTGLSLAALGQLLRRSRARLRALEQAAADRERELTALRRSEQELRAADRRKTEFLAILSHELRNPLAPIRSSLYVLARTTRREQAEHAREVIDRQVCHMTRLIDDLLDVSRIARGKVRLQRERVELGALVRRTAQDFREVFARSGIDFEVQVPERPLHVDGDPTRLAQVVGNLLQNAARFTPRSGRVTLSLAALSDDAAVLRVRDDGVGMAREDLERIFEPFVQAESGMQGMRGGLGLGLALVRGIVEAHGGLVRARSEGPGRGTEMVLELPACGRGGAAEPKAPPVAEPPVARRVLVIDDDVDAAQSLREALELGAHQVEVAFAGREGLEKARRFAPDVVFCDIGLPEMDGYAVARAMRADPRLRPVSLVALTGHALDEDVERCRAAGFDRHVAKPPDPRLLQQTIAELRGPGARG